MSDFVVSKTYSVNAYQCDVDTATPVNLAMPQGSLIGICIETTGSDAIIDKITSWTMTQEGSGQAAQCVTDGIPNSVSTYSCAHRSNTLCIAETLTMSKFFDQASPGALIATGIAQLVIGRRRVNARIVPLASREEKNDIFGGDTNFGVRIDLKNNVEQSAASHSKVLLSYISVVVGIVYVLFS